METPVPVQQPQVITLEELHRRYGEAMIQFKIIQANIMQLEQQIQQVMNQQPR